MISLHPVTPDKQARLDPQLKKRVSEFEGMLLSQILEKLNDAFRIPGGDDSDSTAESFQSLANNALGNNLAARDGMGISKLLIESLTGKPSGPQG